MNFFFMHKVIELISDGSFIRSVFTNVVRFFGVIVAFTALIGWVENWGTISDLGFGGIMGGIIFQLFYIAAFYMVVHTIFIRANDINEMVARDYLIIPVFTLCIRLIGEALAILTIVLSVGGGLFIWFGGHEALFFISSEMGTMVFTIGYLINMIIYDIESMFLVGLTVMLGSVISAFFVLVISRLIAEMTVVFVDIAMNTRFIRDSIEGNEDLLERKDETVKTELTCVTCGTMITPDKKFCTNCGSKLDGVTIVTG